MDVSHIFDELNDAQREAVSASPGPLLVLAGAGSGKTRVLTHRIAFLVQAMQISPLSILAVTFTNKAAREMRGRIETILGFPVGGMWMGTFHGLSHRLLRAHHAEAGLPSGFEILDSDDQFRLVKRTLKDMGLDEGYWPPRQVQWFINNNKEEGIRSHHMPPSEDHHQQQMVQIYASYEEMCQRLGLVDFAELLLRATELLKNNEILREYYRERFRYVMVDEFQDTNAIQYEWLRLFAEPGNNIMAVGDDDQSIYGWRGARVENILQYEHDFPGTQVVRLEQNYRSTETILKAANAVISHNDGRMGKNLWTNGETGDSIRIYAAFNDNDEARFVLERIQDWVSEGNERQSIAILYRSNAQSRIFEQNFIEQEIPYRIYGGLRFFERAEIRDSLGYLRLVGNRDSDPSFERVVNLPTRGIGNRTVDLVREHARDTSLSLWKSAEALCNSDKLTSRAKTALLGFLNLINELDESTTHMTLPELTDTVLRASGLIEHYKKEKGEKAETRIENLEELVNATRNFNPDVSEEEIDPLNEFLSQAALEAGDNQAAAWEDCVQLMSLHSAKGLEFPLVFLCGMEEGLFPHQRSIEEPGRLEEERRLCYVGMTRAMKVLYVTYAEVRRLHGRENYSRPSRFLSEIPKECTRQIRIAASTAIPQSPGRSQPGGGMQLGSRVHHAKFGPGTIINLEGQGEFARVQVNFEDVGSKWLVLAYANLSPV
ncbi:MAG: DNA helicase-2/ATP-dependent DNA helicase PcrA [Parasphingorhabdus sp.]|jgi:DNA helicase-2/ATP-dependent DNA helicase PcrA